VLEQGVTALPPDVLIVLDASGSMDDDITNTKCTNGCGATSKWAQVVPAINQVVAATEADVHWGLKFFADDTACAVNASAAVGVATNRAAMIASAIMARTSSNGGVANGSRTPTRAGVSQGAAYLMGVGGMSSKYIVLATDGLPNCPMSGNSGNDDTTAAVAAVAAAKDSGVKVFVVGIATTGGNADTTLSMMANAGGLARAGTPTYYPVSSGAELETALRNLVGKIASCTFVLGAPPGPDTSHDYIDVYGDGAMIGQDKTHAGGWDYTDANHNAIQFNGATCDAIKAGTIKTVKVAYQCGIG
jgi:hypothetical protein